MSLNVFITDTPIWYRTPIGPSVSINMSYNSQDALNQNSAFGNKWSFNYGSYLMENPDGAVTIFMPGGAQELYFPANSGVGYTSTADNFNTLTKISANRFQLQFQGGDKYIYDIPSGTSSLQPFLVEERDRWNNSLYFGYDSNVHLTSIIDAQGKVTALQYDTAGHILRVITPFGQQSSFAYDSNGNMIRATDMEGNAFVYSYDADILVTRLESSQGAWQYTYTTDYVYNQIFHMTIGLKDPLEQTESYYFYIYAMAPNGTTGVPIQYTDKRGKASYYVTNDTVEGKAKITDIVYADGAHVSYSYDPHNGQIDGVTDALRRTQSTTYNAQGRPLTVTDPQNRTTRYSYEANGLDVAAVIDSRNVTLATYDYNAYHQPTDTTVDPGVRNESSSLAYTAWGAVSTVTDAGNHTTNYNYNTAKQLTSITRLNSSNVLATLSSYAYDSAGRVRTVTPASGMWETYEYNDLNKVTKTSYSDGTSYETDYVCCRLPGMVKDRAGRKTYYDYDQLHRLSRIQDPQGNTLQMDYDANGNTVKIIDSLGSVTSMAYDNVNQLIKKSYVGGEYQSYAYDEAGRTLSYRDTRGITTRYLYQENSDNLFKIDYPNSFDVTFGYDNLDRVTQLTDATGISGYSYDNLDRVTAIDGPWTNDTITYSYNAVGQSSGVSVAGDAVSYGYDALDRLTALTAPSGSFGFGYVGNTDMMSSLSRPNGTTTGYSYDARERLTAVNDRKSNNSLLIGHAYGYDNRDVRTWVERQIGTDPVQHTNFTYDDISQLTRELSTETPAPLRDVAYAYDPMGNRTSTQSYGGPGNGGTSASYTANPLNQIAGVTTTNAQNHVTNQWFGYYGGNLSDTGNDLNASGAHYSYDDANRLYEIITKNTSGVNANRSTFVYDSQNRRRIEREYNWNAPASTWTLQSEKRLVYDGMNVVQERDASNVVQAKYVWAGNIGGLLSRSVATGGVVSHFYYHYDGSGNVVEMTDASQDVVAQYGYDAFGNALYVTGIQAASNPYRFSTKYLHAASGLYDYGYRFYSPGMGRWINRDPIQESGGLNLYHFVDNNPTNAIDEYGLMVPHGGAFPVLSPPDTGPDPCGPWYETAWYYSKPYVTQLAIEVIIFAATEGTNRPRRSIVLPRVRSYDQPRVAGYDQHHLDPPLGRPAPNYNTDPTIDVLNDNSPRKVPDGLNYHTATGGFQTSLNDHMGELGYSRQQWNALPESTRQTILRRYYGSLGIPYPK